MNETKEQGNCTFKGAGIRGSTPCGSEGSERRMLEEKKVELSIEMCRC